VAQRCDDTVDQKRVNSYVLKQLLWTELSNQKYRQKSLEMLSPTRYLYRVFKISWLTPQIKTALRAVFMMIIALIITLGEIM